MTHRVHNFSAGPGALPLPVLERAKEQLLDFQGSGTSIMEMSHRSQPYDQVHNGAIAAFRQLLGFGEDYAILFMGGGARSQFATLAMNLLPQGGHASYVSTGRWSATALEEAAKLGDAREAWSSEETHFDRVPSSAEFPMDSEAAYVHFTSNNTIFGTQYDYDPAPGEGLLVCDMSSDIMSRPVDVSRYGLIYAGAQKNLGPAGVTAVIIRQELLERCVSGLPGMFSYPMLAAKNSLLNTPPVFPIYMVGLVAQHLLERGGVDAVDRRNQAKADLLYGTIDGSDGFYRGHAQSMSRSRMNVTFQLGDDGLQGAFLEESKAANLVGLKGHRSVGGLRASIYNSVELESVQALVEFMNDFQRRKG